MLKVVESSPDIQYTFNMRRGDRYIGLVDGKRYWKALVCGHPVPMYQTKRCWDCWKPEMGKSQIGKSKKTSIRGEKHHSWKGGRVIQAGYVLIKRPEHPSARKNGYIAEHRLVMEAAIGRYLAPTEEVHHLNHDKTDNRIENLMLFGKHAEHIQFEHHNGDRAK